MWKGEQNEILWKVIPARVANPGSLGSTEAQNLISDEADLVSHPRPTSTGVTRESRFIANEEGPVLTPSNLWVTE